MQDALYMALLDLIEDLTFAIIAALLIVIFCAAIRVAVWLLAHTVRDMVIMHQRIRHERYEEVLKQNERLRDQLSELQEDEDDAV